MKKWGFLFASLMLICSVQADILYVPAAYPTIQSAVTAAVDTDTVIVSPGTYYENIDMDGKAITLTSTDPNDPSVVASTIIDGGGSGTVITCNTFETADTVIRGFLIQNGDAGSGNAGGLYCNNSAPTIAQCLFSNNHAGNFGGGIFCWSAAPRVDNCTFLTNTSNRGAGIGCYQSDPVVANCVFIGNDGYWGGGFHCYESNPVITNCTFSGNITNGGGFGGFGGAIGCFQSSDPTIINCIMWDDFATNGTEVYAEATCSPTISYSVIDGGWSGYGEMNLDTDPLFVDADGIDDILGNADDDVHLTPFSPCINQGTPNLDYAGQLDLDFMDRVRYCVVDIGADEVYFIGWDFSPDGRIDVADLVLFAEGWLSDYDLSDFTALTEIWTCGVE